MFLRRVLLLLGLLGVATACATSGDTTTAATGATLPIGGLPPPVSDGSAIPTGSDGPTSTDVRTTVPIPPDAQIGAITAGNRVIILGDSVMASTSARYSNDMCEALVPLGWQVELDAESGRFVEFGNTVLDKRLAAGWDVGVVLLGNNYRGDQAEYRDKLEKIVQRLSPRPVVLLTVSEFTASRQQVNEVIFEMADKYPNVLIVDWAATTAADTALTGGDGLHLTDTGRAALALQVALALGQSQSTDGKCLTTNFRDDSMGPVTGTTTTTTPPKKHTTTTQGTKTSTTNSPATNPPPTDPPDTNPPGT